MGISSSMTRGAAGLILLAAIVLALFFLVRPIHLVMPATGGARALLRLDNELGATVEPLDPGTARKLGLSSSGGFVVTSVANRGPAFSAGLQVGDIIERIGGRPAVAVDTGSLSSASTQILVNRHGNHAIVTLDFARA
jgi:S1-C subfamily serine protease